MGRIIHFNLYIDKTRTDGGFSGAGWFLQDSNSSTGWSQLPPLPGQESDSVKLLGDDNVTFAIGELLPSTAPSTAVTAIQLAVVFGSRQVSGQINSPFQDQNSRPQCLFLGNTGDGSLSQVWSSSNNNGGYFAWVLGLGSIPQQSPGPNKRFELMVGAQVTFDNGTVVTLGHDPEVDVGMGSN